jgi:hypothetical protein
MTEYSTIFDPRCPLGPLPLLRKVHRNLSELPKYQIFWITIFGQAGVYPGNVGHAEGTRQTEIVRAWHYENCPPYRQYRASVLLEGRKSDKIRIQGSSGESRI